ncbi:uncharacterized protein ASPGLDRAFT_213078 [Aspergillus glaucus CBS 516.65]|uniref:Uncharacterized protein n=1 Tax=Aspergillus glaucus CBS 516.65 TaxID=1160497 RepID=A0A1L9VZ63_ASPGL|nr:hypothetical protein ASPGLDRAFT_213078 [Aspergillus glaucus CBS 516.65]OJJ89195.1 hypothetical protein ASPGLDRAFT_213078 [Aspergillus glaucus CBS 516.65]
MPYVQEGIAEEEKETRRSGEEQDIYIASISRGHPLHTTKAVVPSHIRRVRTGSYDNPITSITELCLVICSILCSFIMMTLRADTKRPNALWKAYSRNTCGVVCAVMLTSTQRPATSVRESRYTGTYHMANFRHYQSPKARETL